MILILWLIILIIDSMILMMNDFFNDDWGVILIQTSQDGVTGLYAPVAGWTVDVVDRDVLGPEPFSDGQGLEKADAGEGTVAEVTVGARPRAGRQRHWHVQVLPDVGTYKSWTAYLLLLLTIKDDPVLSWLAPGDQRKEWQNRRRPSQKNYHEDTTKLLAFSF